MTSRAGPEVGSLPGSLPRSVALLVRGACGAAGSCHEHLRLVLLVLLMVLVLLLVLLRWGRRWWTRLLLVVRVVLLVLLLLLLFLLLLHHELLPNELLLLGRQLGKGLLLLGSQGHTTRQRWLPGCLGWQHLRWHGHGHLLHSRRHWWGHPRGYGGGHVRLHPLPYLLHAPWGLHAGGWHTRL